MLERVDRDLILIAMPGEVILVVIHIILFLNMFLDQLISVLVEEHTPIICIFSRLVHEIDLACFMHVLI